MRVDGTGRREVEEMQEEVFRGFWSRGEGSSRRRWGDEGVEFLQDGRQLCSLRREGRRGRPVVTFDEHLAVSLDDPVKMALLKDVSCLSEERRPIVRRVEREPLPRSLAGDRGRLGRKGEEGERGVEEEGLLARVEEGGQDCERRVGDARRCRVRAQAAQAAQCLRY